MAIGIYFAPAAMTREAYEECLKRLRQAGAAHPAGRTYHACFGPNEKVMVFDVWTSQAAFDRFGKTLMPILQALGADPGQPSVMPIIKVITKPAAKPTSKKRAAAKPAPRRLGKKKR